MNKNLLTLLGIAVLSMVVGFFIPSILRMGSTYGKGVDAVIEQADTIIATLCENGDCNCNHFQCREQIRTVVAASQLDPTRHQHGLNRGNNPPCSSFIYSSNCT